MTEISNSFQRLYEMRVVLIKKDVVLFKKEAARENPLWRRTSFIPGNSVRETVFRGKLWAIKRGDKIFKELQGQ